MSDPTYRGTHENLAVEAVIRRIVAALRVPLDDGETWPMLKCANPDGGDALYVPLDEERVREGFMDPTVNRDADDRDIPCILVRLTEGDDPSEQSQDGPGYLLKVAIVAAVFMEEASDYRQAVDIMALLRRSFLERRFLDGGAFRVRPPFTWRASDNPVTTWPHYVAAAELSIEAPSITEVYDEHGQTFNDSQW